MLCILIFVLQCTLWQHAFTKYCFHHIGTCIQLSLRCHTLSFSSKFPQLMRHIRMFFPIDTTLFRDKKMFTQIFNLYQFKSESLVSLLLQICRWHIRMFFVFAYIQFCANINMLFSQLFSLYQLDLDLLFSLVAYL